MPPDDALHFSHQPRVVSVPPVAMRLQKRAAAALFARLEVWYVPAPLIQRLQEFDVVYALRDFFSFIRLDYDVLTTPGDVDHHAQRRQLDEVVDILFAAEQACEGTPFSPDRVTEALARSTDEAEALLDRLERSGLIWRWIASPVVRWPAFAQFRTAAIVELQSWETVQDVDLDHIFSIAVEYERLKTRATTAESQIRTLAATFAASKRPESERELAAAIASSLEEVLRTVDEGELQPDAAVTTLEELLHDLSELWSTDEPGPHGSSGDATQLRVRYLRILELEDDVDEQSIKRAWRHLAKRFHPDLNPDNPEAQARMKEINEAYKGLLLMQGHLQTA